MKWVAENRRPLRRRPGSSFSHPRQSNHRREKSWRPLSPEAVTLSPSAAAVGENIQHLYLICEERDKPDILRNLLPRPQATPLDRLRASQRGGGTSRRQARSSQVGRCGLSAGLDKKLDRKHAMDGIRSGAINIMIASDLAARGLNIPAVTHVFNLDVPRRARRTCIEWGVPGAPVRAGHGDLAAYRNRGQARAALRAGARDCHAVCKNSRRPHLSCTDGVPP